MPNLEFHAENYNKSTEVFKGFRSYSKRTQYLSLPSLKPNVDDCDELLKLIWQFRPYITHVDMSDLKFDAENRDKSLALIWQFIQYSCANWSTPAVYEYTAERFSETVLYRGFAERFSETALYECFKQILSYTKTTLDTVPLTMLAGRIRDNSAVIKPLLIENHLKRLVAELANYLPDLHEDVLGSLAFFAGDTRMSLSSIERSIEVSDTNVYDIADTDTYLALQYMRLAQLQTDVTRPYNLPGIDFAFYIYNAAHHYINQTQYYEQARNLLQIASDINRGANGAVLCFNINKLKYWIPEIETDDSAILVGNSIGRQTNSGLIIPIKINSTSSDGKIEFDSVRLPMESNGGLIRQPQVSCPKDMCAGVTNNSLVTTVSELPLPIAPTASVKERFGSFDVNCGHILALYLEDLADKLVESPSTDIEEGRVEAKKIDLSKLDFGRFCKRYFDDIAKILGDGLAKEEAAVRSRSPSTDMEKGRAEALKAKDSDRCVLS